MNALISHATRLCCTAAVLITMLLAVAGTLPAQLPELDTDQWGRLYYIAFPDTVANRIDPRFPNNRVQSEATLWLWSPVRDTVRITTEGGNTDMIILEPGRFRVHTFKSNPVVTAVNTVLKKGIKVESDLPIVIYCYFAHFQNSEAWTPIPVDNWGTKYYAAAVPGETVRNITGYNGPAIRSTTIPAPATILVVSAFDNTKVTITPPAGLRFSGGAPTTVTLNEGEVFQVQSRVDTSATADDIAAIIIQSDKPVGVISGNTRARVTHDDLSLMNNMTRNLLIEWIPPVDQHGRKFVWLPTWDQHRPGVGAPAERHREFARVYNTSGQPDLGGFYLQPDVSSLSAFSIANRDTLMEFAFGHASAVYFEMARPSMAMMHSASASRQVSSTPTGWGVPAQEYEGWAPYMVTMVPREQWGSFAPHYAPTNPGAMQHFVSVVTDTVTAKGLVRENGTLFPLTRRIPGTDLIWGTANISPGEDHWLHASKGGTFYAVAFGMYRGEEKYRPSGLTEYEEYNALAYGYPLAARHRVLAQPDTLLIDTALDCSRMTITIRTLNPNPTGLRSIILDAVTVENVRLVPVDPARLSDIIGRSKVEVYVEPINLLKNASARALITDRTGRVIPIPYSYEAEYVEMEPSDELNFGDMPAGYELIQPVTVTNPLSHPVKVKELRLAIGNQDYKIVDSDPAVPIDLAPGQTMIIQVSTQPQVEGRQYVDTLKVVLGCTTVDLPLFTETGSPRIYMADLPFGLFFWDGDTTPKTIPVTIQNIGSGDLRLGNAINADSNLLLTWTGNGFHVDSVEIRALKNLILKANAVHRINVTFDPVKAYNARVAAGQSGFGVYRAVGRVYANTREIRDTSVWTAEIIEPVAGVEGTAGEGTRLAVASVSSGTMRFTYAVPAPAHVRLEVFSTTGKPVALLLDEGRERGEHEALWNTEGLPGGIYFCRMTAGDWGRTVPVVLVR